MWWEALKSQQLQWGSLGCVEEEGVSPKPDEEHEHWEVLALYRAMKDAESVRERGKGMDEGGKGEREGETKGIWEAEIGLRKERKEGGWEERRKERKEERREGGREGRVEGEREEEIGSRKDKRNFLDGREAGLATCVQRCCSGS